MKVLLTGSSGMIGDLILKHCLNSIEITEIKSLVRTPSRTRHSKLKEIVIENFEDYSKHVDLFQDIDIAFFCIGVYTGKVPDDFFKVIEITPVAAPVPYKVLEAPFITSIFSI